MSRHLVVLDKAVDKPLRREWTHLRQSDVDVISLRHLDDWTTEAKKGRHDGALQWKTISVIFRGSHEHGRRHTEVMGFELHMDVNDEDFSQCANNRAFQRVMQTLAGAVTDGVYLYALDLALTPGLQQLLKPFHPQVYWSSVGRDGPERWDVEWGNHDWYVLPTKQRQHARMHLFRIRQRRRTAHDVASPTYDRYMAAVHALRNHRRDE